MREQVLTTFEKIYGHKPQYLVRAPGRANLIGGHTDYNDGFVMPLAVDYAVWIALSPREDKNTSIYSLNFEQRVETFSQEQLQERDLPHWTRHIRGAWWLMAQDEQNNQSVPGANIVIGGNIPMGGGMSSSAAIGVAVIEAALVLLENKNYSQADKAKLAVEIEHRFMGMPCGILDQMASAAAIEGSAMLLDCRTLETTPVPISDSVRVVVMNSMKSRELASSGYAERRVQCEAAAAILSVKALRDATPEMVLYHKKRLGEVKFKRAWHIVTENQRVLAMKAALENRDLAKAGDLLNKTHASLRDSFEISVKELDIMCNLAAGHDACYGARIMGGGFGGCAVGLVKADEIQEFIEYMTPRYEEKTGLKPEIYSCNAAPGSSVEILD